VPANTPTAVAAPRKVMPVTPALAYLDMIDGDRRQIEIMKPETTIGRMDDNDVMIDAPNVSRQHVRIVIRDGEAEIINLTAGRGPDEGGVNPVEVNGAQIEGSAPLANNDLVRLGNIGQTRFVFRKAKS
jgi:pSer/pThr/pTyr-binding forkhead associated (FHA) protein